MDECSSCLTSRTVPSLKVHLTMSVSGDTPFTHSLEERAEENLEKSCSLVRCQASPEGASMTADSRTEVARGAGDMIAVSVKLMSASVSQGAFDGLVE